MTNKTLFFEGAGWDGCKAEYNNINCRIRTAFHNNDGKMIYIEIFGVHPNQHALKKAKTKGETLPTTHLYIDEAFYITDDNSVDDCNENRIKVIDYKEQQKIEYTLENIRDFINNNFNCSFDSVAVLDNLARFKVFADVKQDGLGTSKSYNFGDTFNYDEETTTKRIEKVKELSENFKTLFNMEYDNTSYYIKDNELTVRLNVSEKERIKAGYKDRVFTVEI